MIDTPQEGKPDRNEPDSRIGVGELCLIYGLPQPFKNLNGREAIILGAVDNFMGNFYPPGEVWYECAVHGYPTIMNLRNDHLMLLTDSDALVIEKLYVDK